MHVHLMALGHHDLTQLLRDLRTVPELRRVVQFYLDENTPGLDGRRTTSRCPCCSVVPTGSTLRQRSKTRSDIGVTVEGMSRARLRFLERDEEELIHLKSLEVLGDIGVKVRSGRVLSMLGDAGADVDLDGEVARLPEDMVEEALAKAPSEFSLCARDTANDLALPAEKEPYLTTDGLTLTMTDLDTGERRNATREDFADFAKLADALDALSFYWPIVTISDVPPQCHSSYELWTGLQNCALHVQGDCTSARDARKQIELASLVAGDEDELRRRPLFSAATNPISPLSFDEGAVEAQVEFAKAGVPILCHSMSMSGMSAPVTLAGTILNINSENLASIVISQCASPGAPHIYGSSSAPMDMRTATLNYLAPEGLLIAAAAGQMADRYGRPCMVANWGVGRNGPGFGISFSEALAYLGGVLAGSDLVSGVGGLDAAEGCSMEQVVLDSFMWDNFRAYLRRFEVNDRTLALDAIREVGHGNGFLSNLHTARNFREELFLWDREKLSMERTHSNDMIPKARETVRRLLSEHVVQPLDADVAAEGERILADYARHAVP